MSLDTAANNLVKIPLASPHTGGATSLVLAVDGTAFPAPPFRITGITGASYGSSAESLTIYGVTAVATNTPGPGECTLTVSAIEGTSDQAYGTSDYAEVRLTAGTIADLNAAVAALQAVPPVVPGGGNTLVQYDDAGSFAGIPNASSDGTNLLVATQSLYDNSNNAASTAYVDTEIVTAFEYILVQDNVWTGSNEFANLVIDNGLVVNGPTSFSSSVECGAGLHVAGNPLEVDTSIVFGYTALAVNGSVSGTAAFSMPFVNLSGEGGMPPAPFLLQTFQAVAIYLDSLHGTATWAFTQAFNFAPCILATNSLASSVVTSLSPTSVTVTGSGTTGWIILMGF